VKDPKAAMMPLIIAHRGDSAHAPENTLAAFRRAAEVGADGIEFDVRLTKDGEVVVFHDSSLHRIANRKSKIIQLAAEELRTIDMGSWFNRKKQALADPQFAHERIPTLAETLSALEAFEGLLYIELKGREEDIEGLARAVCGLIRNSPLFPQIIVKSFKLNVPPLVKEFCPGARTAALFAPKVRSLLRKNKHLLDIAEETGADEISVHYTLATRKVCDEAARRGMDVVIWTADHARWIRRGMELSLKAIITNDPAKMLVKRRELHMKRSGR
jgi:glycerophosphoryl diester phosphodiesterase